MSLSGGLETGAEDGSAGESSFYSPLVGELVEKMFVMYTPENCQKFVLILIFTYINFA